MRTFYLVLLYVSYLVVFYSCKRPAHFSNHAGTLQQVQLTDAEAKAELAKRYAHADSLRKIGQYVHALTVFESYLNIAEPRHWVYNRQTALVYNKTGNIYTRFGDNETAIQLINKALAVFIALKDTEMQASSYTNLSTAYWNAGNNRAALEKCNLGLRLPNVSAKRRANLWLNSAENYASLQQYDSAKYCTDKAWPLINETKAENQLEREAVLYSIQGNYKLHQGDLEGATADIQNAIEKYSAFYGSTKHREIGKQYLQLARIADQKTNYAKALELEARALGTVLNYKPKSLQTLPEQSSLYAENTIMEALDTKAATLQKMYAATQDTAYLIYALKCYSLAFAAENELLNQYSTEQAKLILQQESRNRSRTAMTCCYELYKRNNTSNYVQQALFIAEYSKSRWLLEQLRNDYNTKAVTEQDENYLNGLHAMQQKANLEAAIISVQLAEKVDSLWLKELHLQLQKWSSIAANYKRKLQQQYPAQLFQLHEPEIAVYKPYILRDHANMVEYLDADSVYYIMALGHGKAQMAKVQKLNDLNAHLQTYNEACSSRLFAVNYPDSAKRAAYYLYGNLVAPVKNFVKGKVLLIPDGVLSQLSFDALLTDTSANTGASPAYLVLNSNISYSYSMQIAHQQMKCRYEQTGILAFIADENSGAELAGANREWKYIQSYFTKVKCIHEQQATVAAFRKFTPKYNILHFGSHAGTFSTAHYKGAGLLLKDSLLPLPALFTMKIPAQLVVLSACETGVGTNYKAEGVWSINRAFINAGAGNMICSLWNVNDEATAKMMDEFYTALHQKAGDCPEALYQAKLKLLKNPAYSNFHSPYYWSAWVCYDAGQKVKLPISIYRFRFSGLILFFFFMGIISIVFIRKRLKGGNKIPKS